MVPGLGVATGARRAGRSSCRPPAGKVCSSTRAELVALREALDVVLRREAGEEEKLVVICTDSQAAIATLANGAGAHTTALGAAIWRLLLASTEGGRHIFLQ